MKMLTLLLSLILLSPYANAYDARPLNKNTPAPFEGVIMDVETSRVVYKNALENPVFVKKIESLEISLRVQTESLGKSQENVDLLEKDNKRLAKAAAIKDTEKWIYGTLGVVLGAFIYRAYGR